MLKYLGKDEYEFWPSGKGEPIVLSLNDINEIAEESEPIEGSYVNTMLESKEFWSDNYAQLKRDIQALVV